MSSTPPRRASSSAAAGKPAALAPLSKDSQLAAEIKALVVAGEREVACERFSELVSRQQRRAVRIAYQYLRDGHDADEAVQDAFFKVFTHINTYRENLPFEVWFTRILVNGCLDLRKSRARRLRWAVPLYPGGETVQNEPASTDRSAEDRLMAAERARFLTEAVEQLPDRQRAVFTLSQIAQQTTAEVGAALGLSEATVRVHLFRAIRKLRRLLAGER
jgi:RNA polymerase sigma-70 factor, ECF subfamily